MQLQPSASFSDQAMQAPNGSFDDLSSNSLNGSPNRPWFKEPYVWIVIAGPLSAVVACIVTAFYIMQGPDAVVPENHYPAGIEISTELKTAAPPMQAAQIARNHSATGGNKDAGR